jgi:PKD repeat protein
VAAAITYANDNGARVANLSLGAQVPAWLMQPIADAMSAAPDLVFAAAAGNGGTDLIGDDNDVVPFYPASFSHSNLISVAATDHNDDLAGFSNYGAVSVDLGAPGVSVPSSVLDSWDVKSGTSMATPHVAGVAALVRSRFPGASADDTVQAILDGADPLSGLSGKTATGGRLNAAASLYGGIRPNAVATATPNAGDIPLTVTFDGSRSTDPDGTIESYQWSFSDGPSALGEVVERTFAASGTISATLVVTDNDGNQDSDEIAIIANAPPVAIANASPSLGVAPLLVTLDGTRSTDPDGVIESHRWDLGSGVNLTGSLRLHDFEGIGVHSVELTVTDDFGSSGSHTIDVLVGFPFTDITASVFGLDIAWLSATGITKGCNPPLNDQFCPAANVTRGQMAAFLIPAG